MNIPWDPSKMIGSESHLGPRQANPKGDSQIPWVPGIPWAKFLIGHKPTIMDPCTNYYPTIHQINKIHIHGRTGMVAPTFFLFIPPASTYMFCHGYVCQAMHDHSFNICDRICENQAVSEIIIFV